MKRIVLALFALLGTVASASATCTSPAVMHDFPGTAFNMSLATNAGDGNCISNIGLVGTLPAYAAIPAFKIDQTTPGTTNGVQVNAALPAGTNLMGKVGIDQTTPGTTNGVQVNAALPAGTNLIGKAGIDQTTPGTTNGVVVNASTPEGTLADAPATLPATTTNASIIALLKALANVGQYPSGATAITASATGTTAATTATLAGAVGKTTYICGYSIRANATAAATVTNTITGVITATLSSIMWVAPLASGIGVDEQIFNPCIPASATNTGIAIVSGAPGSGGTVSSKGWGYQL